ncbi:sigma 54-interacting transcriptional regulator [Wukongibacter baidiensis]|uniref:sigma-54 interaction domain-containing protein n=1 Tax=Wukongibacter baidiensis TaxID=1723361 RepID=UPI003D7FEA3C
MLSLFKEVLNNANEGIIILDTSYEIIYMNELVNVLFSNELTSFKDIAICLNLNTNPQSLKEEEEVKYRDKVLKLKLKSCVIERESYFIVYIEDCTDLHRALGENYCFSTVLNSINEGVLLSDTNGVIWFYNKQMQNFEGLNPQKILGKHITEVYDVKPENSEHLTVLKNQSPIMDRYQKYHTIHGKEIHLTASTYPLLRNGEIISTYSISRNLTTIKELLEQMKRLQMDHSPLLKNTLIDNPQNNTRFTLDNIIGKSPEIRNALKKAKIASKILSPILICGETGTGKELFVQGIHNQNPITKHHPFIAINCAAIPESLLESLLFGAVKGSFTGSTNSTGLFEQAGQGTLFLDEINSMPLNLQAKLLRVLQEKKYRKLGGKEELPVECRIMSSTNIDPLECINKSILRKDLYFRLAVISLEIPPLRKRPEDIPMLIEYFIKDFAMKYGKPIISVSSDLKVMLSNYNWPGNVRELEHVIESAMTMVDCEDTLMLKHLPENLISIFGAQKVSYQKPSIDNLSVALEQAERTTILNALDAFDWNVSRSARELGIARQNLQYRIRKLKLERPRKNA